MNAKSSLAMLGRSEAGYLPHGREPMPSYGIDQRRDYAYGESRTALRPAVQDRVSMEGALEKVDMVDK